MTKKKWPNTKWLKCNILHYLQFTKLNNSRGLNDFSAFRILRAIILALIKTLDWAAKVRKFLKNRNPYFSQNGIFNLKMRIQLDVRDKWEFGRCANWEFDAKQFDRCANSRRDQITKWQILNSRKEQIFNLMLAQLVIWC